MRRKIGFSFRSFTWVAITLLGVICLLTPAAFGQSITPLGRTSQEHPGQKYKLEGTVINSVTGEPIPRALVRIQWYATTNSVLSGGDGRFHFDAVPEGQAVVSAQKPGFFVKNAGKTHPWQADAITVGPQTPSITVALVPESVIYGHVEDANGEPVENAQVRIVQVRIEEGRKKWNQVAGGQTDEEGDFRIADLSQGTYYVGVDANWSLRRNPAEQSKKNREGYPAVVYYPTSPDLWSAQPVNLAPGQRMQLQFALKQEPLFRVSGKVTGMLPGTFPNFQFVDGSNQMLNLPTQFERQDGTFRSLVPSGTYLLRVTAPDNKRNELVAEQTIVVASDVTDVHFSLAPVISVPVLVRTEITKPTPEVNVDAAGGYQQEVNIQFVPSNPSNRGAWANFDPQEVPSALKVRSVLPGKYWVEVMAVRGDRYVQSARCGTVDLLREELVVPPGVQLPPIEVVLRDDTAELTSKLPNIGGDSFGHLLIVPQFAPMHPRVVPVYGQNEYQSPGLAPGDYKVFAFDSLDQVEYTSAETLSRYESHAATVSLSANGKASVTLELIRTGE
jgi:hypothetical protein